MRWCSFDWDDLCLEWEELVEAGELDPKKTSLEEWVEDQWSSMCADAYDSYKASRWDC